MIVVIGMETSGKLRRRFQARGIETYSIDILPSEDDGEDMAFSENGLPLGRHLIGDVIHTLDHLRSCDLWPSLAIFHPDCTTHTVSAAWALKDPDYDRYPGVGYHQRISPGTLVGQARRDERSRQEDMVRRLRYLDIETKIFENPVSTLRTGILGEPNDIVQPWEFGADASKKTCFWRFDRKGDRVNGWGLLRDPSLRFSGRAGPGMIERWSNQTDRGQNKLTPGADRWKDRSRTYDGIADALIVAATDWVPQPDMFASQ